MLSWYRFGSGSVRFWFDFGSISVRFGSVRFGFGSVRFGAVSVSVSLSDRIGSVRFGSVRFGLDHLFAVARCDARRGGLEGNLGTR